jgi:hypothetical protein
MMHLVQKQIEGLPLAELKDTDRKRLVEYQVRSKHSGRILHIYVEKDKAKEHAERANLHCYKVITISERI